LRRGGYGTRCTVPTGVDCLAQPQQRGGVPSRPPWAMWIDGPAWVRFRSRIQADPQPLVPGGGTDRSSAGFWYGEMLEQTQPGEWNRAPRSTPFPVSEPRSSGTRLIAGTFATMTLRSNR
jgi:hypothetical protein